MEHVSELAAIINQHFNWNKARVIPDLVGNLGFWRLDFVNPIALRKNIEILTENKRMITHLKTEHFRTVLYIEVGATYVGSIHQTFEAEKHYGKGEEKGYFSFGGSCIILLFEPFRVQFDADLLEASEEGIEVLGKMGQSLGRAL